MRALGERGTTSVYYLICIFLVCLLALGFLFFYNRPCANFREVALQTPTQNISISLANTPQEQARGLGGCTYIPKDSGMYFTMAPARTAAFWMKDMRIPIDIIWIRDGIVVGVDTNIPNEPKGTPDSSLKTYPSPGEIDAVLEVA